MKLVIIRKTADRRRSLVARAALAALMVAAAATPTMVAIDAFDPIGLTVSADPNDGPALPDPAGNPVKFSPQYTTSSYDDWYPVPDAGGGGGGG